MSLNKVMLIGRVGQEPDVRTFLEGDRKVANLSLATSKRYTDRSGERREQTEWHRVSVFGRQAEFVENYVKKGAQVYVEGELRTRSYTDKNGQEKSITEVMAEQVQLLSQIEKESDDAPAPRSARPATSRPDPAPAQAEDFQSGTDDLPF